MESELSPVLDSRGKERVQTVNDLPSLTVQSERDKADIQKILSQYSQVGILSSLNDAEAMFMDISEFTDLADALQQSRRAEVEFMQLPSKAREIFNHDVAVWLDSAHDKDKRDALVAGGFIKDPNGISADSRSEARTSERPKEAASVEPEAGGGAEKPSGGGEVS